MVDFVFTQALKGWKKLKVAADVRRPVSFDLLQELLLVLPGICSSGYEVTLFRCAFTLAFFGALRIGELIPRSGKQVGGLLSDDVLVVGDRLKLRLRRSKTDMYGNGVWLSVNSTRLPFCPVDLARSFMNIWSEGPVFLVHKGGSPLSQYQFSAVFRVALSACGRDPSEFGTHSFRIGAATVADSLGLPVDHIKSLGRWRSDCYMRYIRPNLLV